MPKLHEKLLGRYLPIRYRGKTSRVWSSMIMRTAVKKYNGFGVWHSYENDMIDLNITFSVSFDYKRDNLSLYNDWNWLQSQIISDFYPNRVIYDIVLICKMCSNKLFKIERIDLEKLASLKILSGHKVLWNFNKNA